MKKTMKMMLALMAGAMAFTSCQEENILDEQPIPSALKSVTFTAFQEGQDGASRAAIDGTYIKWVSGDAISIFDGSSSNSGNQKFTLTDGAGTTCGTFAGEAADASTYYAIYPYAVSSYEEVTVTYDDAVAAAGDAYWIDEWQDRINNDEDFLYDLPSEMEMYGISAENQTIILAYFRGDKVINKSGPQLVSNKIEDVVFPAEQTATAGSADPKAMLMIGKTDNKDALEFKNVCAYVKVKPLFDCYAIGIRSNGGQQLAGTVTVDYNGGKPTTAVTGNGVNEVFLTGTITAGNTYYIAVRPEALSSGFTIEFLTSEIAENGHYYARTTGKELSLARNNVSYLGEFTTTDTTWTCNSATSGNDGNDPGHGWILLTPTLKLATSIAAIDTYAKANSGLWGDNWVLPTQEEMSPFATAGAVSYQWSNSTSIVNIKGQGVLKYITDNITYSQTHNIVWLAEFPNVMDFNGGRIFETSDDPTWKWVVLYKYIGE